MRKKFLVFEGLSGVGKTTVTRNVAKHLSAVLLATPPTPYADYREMFDINVSPIARFYFYLSGIAHASDLIRNYISTAHVVCDRYLPSTIAYHQAMGVDTERLFPKTLHKEMLIWPDQIFLLECSDEAERKKRMKSRGLSFNDKDEIKRNLDTAVLGTYRGFNPTIIETAGKNEQQVTDEVISRIIGS